MIVVRNCFIAKPGLASKLAALLKEAVPASGITSYRVLTDLTGDMNRVVLEFEFANVSEFEERLRDYMSNNAFRDKMKGYTDMYVTGSRELLQIT